MAETVGRVHKLLSFLLQNTRGRVSIGELTTDWLLGWETSWGRWYRQGPRFQAAVQDPCVLFQSRKWIHLLQVDGGDYRCNPKLIQSASFQSSDQFCSLSKLRFGTSCFFVVRSPEVFYNRFITCVRCFSNGCREANLGEKWGIVPEQSLKLFYNGD